MSRRKISRSLIAGLFTGFGSIGAFAFGLAVVAPGIFLPDATPGGGQESPTGQQETVSGTGGAPSHFATSTLVPPGNIHENVSPDASGSSGQGGGPAGGGASGPDYGQLPGNDPVDAGDDAFLGHADATGDDAGTGSADGDSAESFGGFNGFGFSRQGLTQGFAGGAGNGEEGAGMASLDTADGGTPGSAEDSNRSGEGPAPIETSENDPPSPSLPDDEADSPPSFTPDADIDPDTGPASFLPSGFDTPPGPQTIINTPPSPDTGGAANPQETQQGPAPGPVADPGPVIPPGDALQPPAREVPEPGSLGLAVSGLLGMRWILRNRRRTDP